MSEARIVRACPDCGRELVVRTNRRTGGDFLGCSGWPRCSYTEPIPQGLVMRRLGAPTLPGFEVDRC